MLVKNNDGWREVFVKETNHASIDDGVLLNCLFGITKYQPNATFGYKSKLKRESNHIVFSRNAPRVDGRSDIKHNSWYVLCYTPNLVHQGLLNYYFITKIPLGISYVKRSVTSEDLQ